MRIVVLTLLAACGSDPAPPPAGPDGSVQCMRWNMSPASAVIGANTPNKEASPSIGGDHGLLAFTSNPGGFAEIYTLGHFSGETQATKADALDDGTEQLAPHWNVAGTRLYFSRAGALWSSAWDGGNFAAPAKELGLAGETVVGTTFSNDELEMFYGDNADPTLSKLHRATRAKLTDPWAAQGELTGDVNTGGASSPSLSHDQFTLYWETHRETTPKLYTAVRQTPTAPFGQVELFDQLAGADGDPDDSSHDEVFAFTSHDDIIIATRTCMAGT